jgi:hypothetical protein
MINLKFDESNLLLYLKLHTFVTGIFLKYIYLGFQKPKFTKFPETLITVPPDKRYSVRRKYSVEGTPPPSITWYKMNGDKVERLWNCNESACTYNNPDDYDLHITKTFFRKYSLSYPNDNTTFKCVAANSLGSATKTFQLNILGRLLLHRSIPLINMKIFVQSFLCLTGMVRHSDSTP